MTAYINSVVLLVMLTVLVGTKIVAFNERWRAKRNARWLDSADACKVGSRKWAK